MNTTDISCDLAQSTFVPFYQNAIKKLELFRNDSPTIIPLDGEDLCQ